MQSLRVADILAGPKVLPAIMGSPGPYGRQLDGMGSGVSSASKICILSQAVDRELADIQFTFVQVGVKDGSLDMAGNCGNMLSIIGPIAFDAGLQRVCKVEADPAARTQIATVRILNTNSSKVVHA